MKKQLPLVVGFLVGTFAVLEWYIPSPWARDVQGTLTNIAVVLAGAAYFVGGLNILQVNVPHIARRHRDWGYKIVLVAGAGITLAAGIAWHTFGDSPKAGTVAIDPPPVGVSAAVSTVRVVANRGTVEIAIDGAWTRVENGSLEKEVPPGEHTVRVRAPAPLVGYSDYSESVTLGGGERATFHPRIRMLWGKSGRPYTWIFDHLFSPANATMFALLAFFIASAAFRAFRARNTEATLLLGSSILVMFGRVPIGRAIAPVMPKVADWILSTANNAGRRAILMGAAMGAIATGLRVILGLERSHLGKD